MTSAKYPPDVEAAIRLRRLVDFRGDMGREVPKVLWHYTNPQALLSILSTGTFHLTNAEYLNDSRELHHFFDHILGRADDYFADSTPNDQAKTWLPATLIRNPDGGLLQLRVPDSGFRDLYCAQLRRSRDSLSDSNICVASFCENGDLLSQWRAYGSSGCGVAIGFDVAALISLATDHGFLLRACDYLYSYQKPPNFLVTQFIQKSRERLEDFESFHQLCVMEAIRYKDPAFSEEAEWRFIAGPIKADDERLRFRPKNTNLLIPHYELSFGQHRTSLISDVRVGPCDTQELMSKSLDAVGKRYGYRFTVSKSTVPYRA